jgi:cell division FtsZ-interacting protein ZapD
MPGIGNGRDLTDEKAERRAARELIATYHQTQLRALLDRVRAGFAQFDAGDIDEFDLDSLIHHYKRSAAELWKSCGSTGGQWLQAARTLSYLRERAEEPDWWNVGAPRRD